MTRPLPAEAATALEPLRAALLARARAGAAAAVAAADADAAATLRAAREEAAAITAEARALGERDAAILGAAERSRANRRARATVLAAQAAVYDELRRRAREAVRQLRNAPDYPVLVARLRAEALAALGDGATVTELPDGGIVGEVDGRRADLGLVALADQALAALGPEVAALWTP